MTETGRERWRELALQQLPYCREIITSASSHIDLWWSFKVLVCEAGSGESAKEEVKSIFGYAWWCVAESGDEDLAAEVEAYFYEDLPVYTDLRAQVWFYIAPPQFERLESCFRYRLDDAEYAAFRSRYYSDREDDTRGHH